MSDAEKQWGCVSLLENDLAFLSSVAGVALIEIAPNSLAALNAASAEIILAGYLSDNAISFEDLSSGCELES